MEVVSRRQEVVEAGGASGPAAAVRRSSSFSTDRRLIWTGPDRPRKKRDGEELDGGMQGRR